MDHEKQFQAQIPLETASVAGPPPQDDKASAQVIKAPRALTGTGARWQPSWALSNSSACDRRDPCRGFEISSARR